MWWRWWRWRESNRNVGAAVVDSFTIHEAVFKKKVECRVDVGSTCLDLLLAIISRVLKLIFVKLLIVFFFVFFIIMSQDAPLGFLLQSQFVCNGGLVNLHNSLTYGA